MGLSVKAMCECEFKSLYNGPPGSRRYLASVSLLYVDATLRWIVRAVFEGCGWYPLAETCTSRGVVFTSTGGKQRRPGDCGFGSTRRICNCGTEQRVTADRPGPGRSFACPRGDLRCGYSVARERLGVQLYRIMAGLVRWQIGR